MIKPEAIVRSKEKVVMQYVQLSRATLKVADNEDPIVSVGGDGLCQIKQGFFERMHQRMSPGTLL